MVSVLHEALVDLAALSAIAHERLRAIRTRRRRCESWK